MHHGNEGQFSIGTAYCRGEEIHMPVRNSAKAVIMKDGCVLLTKNQHEQEIFYLFPGGGQEHGETLEEAVKRECIEEIGQEVVVRELLHVREYIGRNHEHAFFDQNVHQVEFFFACELAGTWKDQGQPTRPDDYQVGVEWIPLNELDYTPFYPKKLGSMLSNRKKSPFYLGDIN